MKQPHRLDDSFRVPRPSGRSENARPTLVVVLALLFSLALFAVAVAEVARIIAERM